MLKLFAKKPYSEIDEKIRPLVDAMNGTGVIQTVASCQGHDYLLFGYSAPYVYFKAPIRVAELIEQQLREANLSNEPNLKAGWTVRGVFDENCKITFLLYSPKYSVYLSDIFNIRLVYELWINRTQLDTEIIYLADLIGKAMQSHVGNKHEQYISQNNNYEGDAKQPKQ